MRPYGSARWLSLKYFTRRATEKEGLLRYPAPIGPAPKRALAGGPKGLSFLTRAAIASVCDQGKPTTGAATDITRTNHTTDEPKATTAAAVAFCHLDNPARRSGRAAEIATALLLAGPHGGFYVGACLPPNGGDVVHRHAAFAAPGPQKEDPPCRHRSSPSSPPAPWAAASPPA
jgi:hypothetical protein